MMVVVVVVGRACQFDGCIGPEAEQQEVMQKVGMKRLLDKVLDGYSSTVMACGQTGSGKTFTMSGREEVGLHTTYDYISQHFIQFM